MRKNKIVSIGIIILFSIMLFPLAHDAWQSTPERICRENTFQVAESISIHGNEEWDLQGWPGNGTQSSPYLIENLTLTSFWIGYSDVFFVVQNCQFDNNAFVNYCENGLIRNCVSTQGFDIDDCSNFILSNVTLLFIFLSGCCDTMLMNLSILETEDFYGYIGVIYSQNVSIVGCYGEKCVWGISLSKTVNCKVQNNTFKNCGYYRYDGSGSYIGGGIQIEECVGDLIENNNLADSKGVSISLSDSEFVELIENHGNAAYLRDCTNCSFINNTLNSTLYLVGSMNCNIVGNELGFNGLSISGGLYSEIPYYEYYNHTISNNTLLGKPILFTFRDTDSNYAYGDYGQVMIVCSIRVFVTQIEDHFTQASIQVMYSDSCVISQVKCNQIRVDYSNRTVIQSCELMGSGISGSNSPETIIYNNTVKDANHGISIRDDSTKSVVANNTIFHVRNSGISILSPECTVENNTITGGLIPIGACYQTTTIMISNFKAISISSDDCLIVNNTAITNNGYGIYVTGSRNTIYGNILAGNLMGNGFSEGTDNRWDDGVDTGNIWGDWIGYGGYAVPGDEGCIDRFPRGYINGSIVTGNSIPALIIISLSVGCAIVIILVLIRIYRHRT